MNDPAAPVWVLLGQRTGDNKQLLRLASELGAPFRSLHLRYTRLHLIPPKLLGASLNSLTRQSRKLIQPPWPELVLGIGHRSVPVALEIRRLSGGKAKLVRLGNPRVDPSHFDLVITTPQYRVADRSNVLRLPLGISTAPGVEATREESEWLARLPRPHRLLLIGGDTFMWSLRAAKVTAAAASLRAKPGGSVISVSSGRSSPSVLDGVAGALRGSEHALVWGGFPRYAVLVQDADEIFVTGDSVAMVSDAIGSKKAVGIIEPGQSLTGRLLYALDSIGIRVPVRDIRQFWREIGKRELVGTLEEPRRGRMEVDPLSEAQSAVRALLDS